MFPARSTARLGMKRWITLAASGSHVVACTTTGIATATFTWYHRGAANPVVFARRTVWVAHRDCAPSTRLYCSCIIPGNARASRLLPPCDGTAAGATLGNADPVPTTSGPVNVDCSG